MSARKPSKATEAAALEALLRQFIDAPRDQQWSFLVKALRHYAEGVSLPGTDKQQEAA